MVPRSRDTTSETGASSSVGRPTRHRTANACDQCRRKRQRCDLDRPMCGLCSYRSESCTYDQGFRGSVPKRRLPKPIDARPVPKSPRSTKDAAVAELRELGDLLNPDYPSAGLDLSDDDSRSCLAFWMQPQATAEKGGALIQEVAQSWPVYSRIITDHAASEHWARTQPANVLYLPSADQAQSLLHVFFQYNNFFFELADPSEVDAMLGVLDSSRTAGFVPETALDLGNALARCRTALATISDEKAESLSLGKRAALLELWNISCIGLLKASRFTESPTLAGLQVLVTLLGTLFFEHQFGLTGGSSATRGLRRLAVKAAYALGLHIDPGNDDRDSDYKRRLWWSINTLDAHFAATGSTPHEIIDLAIADTKIPRSPSWSMYQQPGSCLDNDSMIDLRSSESRFVFSRLNNQITRLIIRQVPLPTVEDVSRMDEVILSWMNRVVPGQSPKTFIDTTDPSSWAQDVELARSQRIAFIAFWHLRARLHRPIVKTERPNISPFVRTLRPQLQSSTSVVIRCSYLLLDMYRLGEMSAAFKAAIAQAAISLLIIAYDWGGLVEEIMLRVGPFIKNIETTTSPTLQRARSLILGLKDVVTQRWEVTSPLSAASFLFLFGDKHLRLTKFEQPFTSPALCKSPTAINLTSSYGFSQPAVPILHSSTGSVSSTLEPLFSGMMMNNGTTTSGSSIGSLAPPVGVDPSTLNQVIPSGMVSNTLLTSSPTFTLNLIGTSTQDPNTLGFFGRNMEWSWQIGNAPPPPPPLTQGLTSNQENLMLSTTGEDRCESLESIAKLDHLKMLLGDEEVDPYLPSSWPSYTSSPLAI